MRESIKKFFACELSICERKYRTYVVVYNKVYMYPYLSVNFQDYGRYMFRQKLNYIPTILFVGSVKTLELSSKIFQLDNTNRDIEYYPMDNNCYWDFIEVVIRNTWRYFPFKYFYNNKMQCFTISINFICC